jgi:hypothetical protein
MSEDCEVSRFWDRNRQAQDLPDSPGFSSECSDAEVRLVLSCAWLLLLVFWRVRCLLLQIAWPTRPSPRRKISCRLALGVCLRCPAHSGGMCCTFSYLHAREHAATDAEASFEHRASFDEFCQMSPMDEDLQVPAVVAWLPLFKMAPPAHRLLIWSARTFVHRTTPR